MRTKAAPCVAEGEAWWTRLPRLTINRRSRALAEGSAQVAQLVEQATENRCVGGSIPPLGTMLRLRLRMAQPIVARPAALQCPRFASCDRRDFAGASNSGGLEAAIQIKT